MADPIYFAPLRVKLVDARTGLMAREWYLFFQALWLRTGGVEAPSNDDVLISISQGLGVAEVQASVDTGAQATGQIPTYVSALQDQMAEMAKEIQALKQGVVP